MSKQDRTFLRTPTDLERKYDFSKIGNGGDGSNSIKVSQLEQTLAKHMSDSESKMQTLTQEIAEVKEEVERIETDSLPIASESTLGGVKIGTNVEIDEDGVISVPVTNGVSPLVDYAEISGGHRLSIVDAKQTTDIYIKDGVDGQDGADAYPPKITYEEISGGHKLTIEDAEETQEVYIKDGVDGQNGSDGANGFSPLIEYTEVSGGHRLTITDIESTQDVYIKDGTDGADGSDGADGVSPIVDYAEISGGHRLSIIDAQQTTDIYIKDGVDGSDGTNGKDGADGVSVATVKQTTTSTTDGGTNVVTVTLSDGTTSTFNVMNGRKGSTGATGLDGSNGTDGVSISSVAQTTTSTVDGGTNVITVTLSDGTTSTFKVKNGTKGSTGATGLDGSNGTDGKDGADGVSVATLRQTLASSADGGTNVMTVTLSDGTTSDFTFLNGSKGSTGTRGTGIYSITTSPSSYTTTTGGFTPTYRIALSTVTSQSGASSILVGDQLRYSYYLYPVGYVDSSYVYCGARVSIRGATGTVTGADYVTDIGTSGIWTYRVWNSGVVELWGTTSFSIAASSWKAWGSNYYADISSGCYVAYPCTFASEPQEFVSLDGGAGSQMWLSRVTNSTYDRKSATNFGNYALRSTALTSAITVYADFYVIGSMV